jgi:hypothetical protein
MPVYMALQTRRQPSSEAYYKHSGHKQIIYTQESVAQFHYKIHHDRRMIFHKVETKVDTSYIICQIILV